jgi:hypothetical protein
VVAASMSAAWPNNLECSAKNSGCALKLLRAAMAWRSQLLALAVLTELVESVLPLLLLLAELHAFLLACYCCCC